MSLGVVNNEVQAAQPRDPHPTRKAAAAKRDCLNRWSSSQTYPVLSWHPDLTPCPLQWNELDPHSLLLTHFIHKFSIFLPWGLLPSTVNSLIYCCKTKTEPPVIARKISKKFHHSGVETVQITLLLQAETLDPIDKMNSFTLTSSDRAQCHQAVAYNEVHFFNHQTSQCIFPHQPSLINLPTQDRHTCWK